MTDDRLGEHAFEADVPTATLEPVWADLPAGWVKVEVTALDAKGAACGTAGGRRFWKSAPYRPGAYPKPEITVAECLDAYFDWLCGMKNTRLIRETGEGVNWFFAPMLDIARDARWGRIAESPGADPFLASRIAADVVRGCQGADPSDGRHVAACAKHFVGYGAGEGGRDYNGAEIGDDLLHNVYLPPFKAAIAAGALTVMPAFSTLCGSPCSTDRRLLRDILRDELGFRGFTVSDWDALGECGKDFHGVADGDAALATLAINAGMDVDMLSTAYAKGLAEAVRRGLVKERTLDEADAIVLALGEKGDESGENTSRTDLTLPKGQMELVRAAKATGRPVVVVLFNGRPLAVPELKREADAVLEAWQLGSCCGWAVADVLAGVVEPYGRLTVDFPQSSGQCPFYYNRLPTGRPNDDVLVYSEGGRWATRYTDVPLRAVYPFGFGLTYTEFRYSEESAAVVGDEVVLSARIANVGKRRGSEVVQAYVRDRVAEVSRPRRELKGFARVELAPGESRRVEIRVPRAELAYWANGRRTEATGEFLAWIAPDSDSGRRLSFTLP